MPYADPIQGKELKRSRYQTDEEFRLAEIARKKAWIAENPDTAAASNRAAVKEWRKNHPEEYREYNRERMRKARAKKKAAATTTH